MSLPEFRSALDYAKVRDFAYPEMHPLYYGVARPESQASHVSAESGEEDGEREHGWGQPHQKYIFSAGGESFGGAGALESASAQDGASLDGDIQNPPDDIYSRAVALFDFMPENYNEIALGEGQIVWVSYRHGQGWLVAENMETGETGLIPEEYVQLMPGDIDEWVDVPDAQQAAARGQDGHGLSSGAEGNTSPSATGADPLSEVSALRELTLDGRANDTGGEGSHVAASAPAALPGSSQLPTGPSGRSPVRRVPVSAPLEADADPDALNEGQS